MRHRRFKIGLFSEASLDKPGGVQEYLRGLYDYLKEKNHRVWIITPGPLSLKDKKRKIKFLGKRVELETPMKTIGSSASMALALAKKAEIQDFLASERFDLLHLTAPFGSLGKKIIEEASRQKIAKVATFLIYRDPERISNYLIKLFLEKPGTGLDKRIALSRAAKEFAQKIMPGRYLVIPSGVDLERFSPRGERVEKYLDDKKNLLFVGRLDRRKGLKYLVQGFAIIKAKFPKARLIIVGKGPEKGKLKRLVKKLGLEDVELAGLVPGEDLPKYYRTADIALFPAIGDESLGIVLLEAIASGKPVIATDIPGYREVKGPCFVPPKDAKALALKTLSLLEDESLRREWAQKSLKAAQEYSWEKIGARILEVYQDVL